MIRLSATGIIVVVRLCAGHFTVFRLQTASTMAMDSTDAAVSEVASSENDTFSPESLHEPLKSYVQQVLSSTADASAKYDVLETQLRSHLLELSQNVNEKGIALLQDEWICCWKLCIHLLTHVADLDRFVRKLPFVLLEDLVETLPLEQLQSFWESSVDAQKLCTGVLWDGPNNKSSSNVLQWIRVQNALLKRCAGDPEWTGRILMGLAQALPLSDRSALKVWGSVSGHSVEFQDDEDYQDTAVSETDGASEATTTSSLPYSFYELFWSLQKDMANPYSIPFAKFFQSAKTVMAALESKPLSNTISASTSKYLTHGRLLPLQLQDPYFRLAFLTQFLIVESFISSQSSQLQATLGDLTNRAKALLRKIPNGGAERLATLEWILRDRESHWRTWKRNKCKPDMDVVAVEKSAIKKAETKVLAEAAAEETITTAQHLTMEDLSKTAKTMAMPDLFEHLEDYADALDPEAGIEAEYHPRNNKLYSWRALRLLSRQHLGLFSKIRRRDGDFELMVRDIYKKEKDTIIPGDAPEEEPDLDYDEHQDTNDKAVEIEKDEEMSPADVGEVAAGEEIVAEEEVPEGIVEEAAAQVEEDEEMQEAEDIAVETAEAVEGDSVGPAQNEKEEEDSEEEGEAIGPAEVKETTSDVAQEEKEEEAAEKTESTEEGEAVSDEEDEAEEYKEDVSEVQVESENKEPLTEFERAALEEEELLIAEEEAAKKENSQEESPTPKESTMKDSSTADDSAIPVDASKKETAKSDTEKKDVPKNETTPDSKPTPVDRKRKRSPESDPKPSDSAKRTRMTDTSRDNSRRNAPPGQLRYDHHGGRGHGGDNRGGWNPGMQGGPPGGHNMPRGGAPHRPPPPGRGDGPRRPPVGGRDDRRGGRGAGGDPGRRGGRGSGPDDGRGRIPPRRDTRRR